MKKNIKYLSIVAYVLVGLNVVIAFVGSPLVLLDCALLLGLTLGVHLGKNKDCAVALLVYTIINAIVSLITAGTVGGWWWIFLAISYLNTFKKIDAEYKAEMAKSNQPSIYDYDY